MTSDDALPSRAVVMLAGVYTAALMTFVRAYHPTNPAHCEQMLVYFASYLCLLGLILYPTTRRLLAKRWVLMTLYPAAHLPVGYAVGEYVGTSLLVAHMLSPSVTRMVALSELLIFLAVLWTGLRNSHLRERMRVIGLTGIFLNALLFIPLCVVLWSPPSPTACEEVSQHPRVTRLTPQSYADELSYPYEVTHLGDGVIAGSFKMAGNTVLQFWDKPESNRVVVVDTKATNGAKLRTLDLPGQSLPEHMAYHHEQQELAVKLVGYQDREIVILDLADPELSVKRRLKPPFTPHAIAMSADGVDLLVFSVDLALHRYDWQSLTAKAHQQLTTQQTIMLLNVTRAPDSDTFFLSSFGPMLTAFDATTGRQISSDVGFAGGDIIYISSKSLVAQTDLLNHRLNLADSISLALLNRIDVPYAPRAIAVDEAHERLFVGDWFGGIVHT